MQVSDWFSLTALGISFGTFWLTHQQLQQMAKPALRALDSEQGGEIVLINLSLRPLVVTRVTTDVIINDGSETMPIPDTHNLLIEPNGMKTIKLYSTFDSINTVRTRVDYIYGPNLSRTWSLHLIARFNNSRTLVLHQGTDAGDPSDAAYIRELEEGRPWNERV